MSVAQTTARAWFPHSIHPETNRVSLECSNNSDATKVWLYCLYRVFVICLLVSDLIQSISGITQVKWAMENRIYEGKSCSVQGDSFIYPLVVDGLLTQCSSSSGNPSDGRPWIDCLVRLNSIIFLFVSNWIGCRSCVIAIHTFCGIALGKSWPRWAVITTVVTGWIFVILMTSIPPAVYSNNGGPPFCKHDSLVIFDGQYLTENFLFSFHCWNMVRDFW